MFSLPQQTGMWAKVQNIRQSRCHPVTESMLLQNNICKWLCRFGCDLPLSHLVEMVIRSSALRQELCLSAIACFSVSPQAGENKSKTHWLCSSCPVNCNEGTALQKPNKRFRVSSSDIYCYCLSLFSFSKLWKQAWNGASGFCFVTSFVSNLVLQWRFSLLKLLQIFHQLPHFSWNVTYNSSPTLLAVLKSPCPQQQLDVDVKTQAEDFQVSERGRNLASLVFLLN